jgi:hypothetical protein
VKCVPPVTEVNVTVLPALVSASKANAPWPFDWMKSGEFKFNVRVRVVPLLVIAQDTSPYGAVVGKFDTFTSFKLQSPLRAVEAQLVAFAAFGAATLIATALKPPNNAANSHFLVFIAPAPHVYAAFVSKIQPSTRVKEIHIR